MLRRTVYMQVKAELTYSDLLTVPDMVCSTAFDRDDEFFATAGVYRRVKIFDFASVQDNDTSIHYPVLEIPSRSGHSKLLLLCCLHVQLGQCKLVTHLQQFHPSICRCSFQVSKDLNVAVNVSPAMSVLVLDFVEVLLAGEMHTALVYPMHV